jgi:hypothetical protein
LVHIPRYYFSVYVALLGSTDGHLPGDGMVAGTRMKRSVEKASSSWNWRDRRKRQGAVAAPDQMVALGGQWVHTRSH